MAQPQRLGLPGRTGGTNKNTELAALNEIIKRLLTQKVLLISGIALPLGASSLAEQQTQTTSLASLLTELQLKADLTETQPVSLLQSNLVKMEQEAADLVKTFAYLDEGLADERVSTIIYTSTALALSVTKTFVYAGGAGTYRVSTITLGP